MFEHTIFYEIAANITNFENCANSIDQTHSVATTEAVTNERIGCIAFAFAPMQIESATSEKASSRRHGYMPKDPNLMRLGRKDFEVMKMSLQKHCT